MPSPTSFYKVEDATGISNGSYNNIPLTTFGFGLANNPGYWTIQIRFTANIIGRYQGLLGNMYNNVFPNYYDGWGFWISDQGYVHFRIKDWNENFPTLGTITINTPHTLVIHFVNDTYIIVLTNNSTNTTKTISVTGRSRLISDRGSICLGGKWLLNNTEAFDGNITLIEFITPFSITKTWNVTWTPAEGAIAIMYGIKQALHVNIRDTLTLMNYYDGVWSPNYITFTNPPFHTGTNVPRNTPLVFRITFNTTTGFGIEYENIQIATYPNWLSVTNAYDLTVNTAFGNTGTITVTETT
jgi:hypothetical protein